MFATVSHIVDIEEVGPCLAASIEWEFGKKRIPGSSYLTICIIMVACSYISAKRYLNNQMSRKTTRLYSRLQHV
jgi:hypothetical protein